MYAAKSRGNAEQWIAPPEPALNRYLLHSCRRAANDNGRLSSESFRAALIGTCMTMVCALSLIVALVR